MNNKDKKLRENEVVEVAAETAPAQPEERFVTQPEKDQLEEITKREIEYLNATSELGAIESNMNQSRLRREELLKIIPEAEKHYLGYKDKVLGALQQKYGVMAVDLKTGQLKDIPQQ